MLYCEKCIYNKMHFSHVTDMCPTQGHRGSGGGLDILADSGGSAVYKGPKSYQVLPLSKIC